MRANGLLLPAAVLAAVVLSPQIARAQLILETSLGQGLQVSRPLGQATVTSVLVAGGYQLHPTLRLSLGVSAGVDSSDHGSFDLELRPMVRLEVPGFPVYARLALGIVDLIDEPALAVGGAIGVEGTFPALALFVEAGAMPREARGPGGNMRALWVIEVRAGCSWDLLQ